MDIWQRRAVLDPVTNPDRNIDYVSTLRGTLSALDDRIDVFLRYVPDASILQPAAFAAYLRALEDDEWLSHESLATTILQDINNEVVPRWVQAVTLRNGSDDQPDHKVMVEDKQPQWTNADLLSRLDTI